MISALKYLQKVLTNVTQPNQPRHQENFWLALSIAYGAIQGFLALSRAFGGEYIIQDDARQHVFWMQRFMDPGLFPNDLIADYFQSVAPIGYTSLYKLGFSLGIDPYVFNKFVPPVLGLVSTFYCFKICMLVFPVPLAGFINSALLNQTIWTSYGLASGTPRSFLYVFLLSFLYSFLKKWTVACCAVVALQGIFYPQVVLTTTGMLLMSLFSYDRGRIRVSRDRQNLRMCIAGAIVGFLILIPFALKTSIYGPTISYEEARSLPEFWQGGRTVFFSDRPLYFWLESSRSGFFPFFPDAPSFKSKILWLLWIGFPPTLGLGIFLALKRKLIESTRGVAIVFGQLLFASTGVFLLAHMMLFKLHLPSRYSQPTLRIIVAMGVAIIVTTFLDILLGWLRSQHWFQAKAQTVAAGVGVLLLVAVMAYQPRLELGYTQGKNIELYAFLKQQPKDILVAGLGQEADNIPSFAARSVLVNREYSIPYQTGYYRQIRQRAQDLLQAQYSDDPTVLKAFLQRYQVDLWLLDAKAFAPQYIEKNGWLRQFQPQANTAIAALERGTVPILMNLRETCAVYRDEEVSLLDSGCIAGRI